MVDRDAVLVNVCGRYEFRTTKWISTGEGREEDCYRSSHNEMRNDSKRCKRCASMSCIDERVRITEHEKGRKIGPEP